MEHLKNAFPVRCARCDTVFFAVSITLDHAKKTIVRCVNCHTDNDGYGGIAFIGHLQSDEVAVSAQSLRDCSKIKGRPKKIGRP